MYKFVTLRSRQVRLPLHKHVALRAPVAACVALCSKNIFTISLRQVATRNGNVIYVSQ